MNKMIYKYQQQWVSMDQDKAVQVISDLEKSLRTGIFNYRKPILSKKQYEEMKRNWTPEAISFFKDKAQKIAGDQKITQEIAYQAAVSTMKEFIAQTREKNETVKFSSITIQRNILLDIAISTMMDVSFEASNIVSNMKIIDGKKIEIRYTRCAMSTNEFRIRFAINCSDVDNSDIFIFAMYNEHLDKMVLLGWKTQSEIRTCKRGNKNTDPNECPWEKMSFYFGYPELNPISDLATKYGLKELPEDVLFEQITQQHYIPIPNPDLAKGLEKSRDDVPSKACDDFYKVLGLSDPEKNPVPQKSEQQAPVNTDDWAMD